MRELFRDKYRTDSVRLEQWDYSWPGYYFVTICVKGHECVFGEIIDGKMQLNELGKIAQRFLVEIPNHFKDIELSEFVVMPNHVHVIVVLKNRSPLLETLHATSLRKQENKHYSNISPKPNSLPTIIRSYKSACTREINKIKPYFGFHWQPKYYDHIIRNEKSLENITNYINLNPTHWKDDEMNPLNLK